MIKPSIFTFALFWYAILATMFAVPEIERRVADWGYDHKVAEMQNFKEANAFIAFANAPNLKEIKDVKRK